jgi:hypothetical protein
VHNILVSFFYSTSSFAFFSTLCYIWCISMFLLVFKVQY